MKTSKLLSLVYAILAFGSLAQANPATLADLKSILGHYEGGNMIWEADAGKVFCTLDIAITKDNKVSVILKDSRGIVLFSRAKNSEKYSTKTLPQVVHPLMSVQEFLAQTIYFDKEISQKISKGSLFTTQDWWFRFANMGTDHAFIELDYHKIDNFAFQDAILSTAETSCFELKKAK